MCHEGPVEANPYDLTCDKGQTPLWLEHEVGIVVLCEDHTRQDELIGQVDCEDNQACFDPTWKLPELTSSDDQTYYYEVGCERCHVTD